MPGVRTTPGCAPDFRTEAGPECAPRTTTTPASAPPPGHRYGAPPTCTHSGSGAALAALVGNTVGTTGEGRSTATLELMGRQIALLDTLWKLDRPFVVLLQGKPSILPARALGTDAIVQAFTPGMQAVGRSPSSCSGASSRAGGCRSTTNQALGQHGCRCAALAQDPPFAFGEGLSCTTVHDSRPARAPLRRAGASRPGWPASAVRRLRLRRRPGARRAQRAPLRGSSRRVRTAPGTPARAELHLSRGPDGEDAPCAALEPGQMARWARTSGFVQGLPDSRRGPDAERTRPHAVWPDARTAHTAGQAGSGCRACFHPTRAVRTCTTVGRFSTRGPSPGTVLHPIANVALDTPPGPASMVRSYL